MTFIIHSKASFVSAFLVRMHRRLGASNIDYKRHQCIFQLESHLAHHLFNDIIIRSIILSKMLLVGLTHGRTKFTTAHENYNKNSAAGCVLEIFGSAQLGLEPLRHTWSVGGAR